MSSSVTPPTAIDLFAGAGGLSLGLRRAGFNVVAAVELDRITPTYKANHPSTALLEKDIRQVSGKDILGACGVVHVDLVAGCPPCQGFSTLTQKHEKDDPRNELVLEMARVVKEISPRMVMMENVPGLASRGRNVFDKFIMQLNSTGYIETWEVLKLANYGVPQSRRRLLFLAGQGFKPMLPVGTHSRTGEKGTKKWLTLKKAWRDIGKPIKRIKCLDEGGPQKFNWHVIRNLDSVSRKRMKELKEGGSRYKLSEGLRPDCHKGWNDGFVNVYGRLSWKDLPPTITSGFLSPSMGRFTHPSKNRTLSVREAAMLQTFPMRYKFVTNEMEAVSDMIGNALPPHFAKIAGAYCVKQLQAHEVA